ncbi:helix-turn-helix transcriptional regulator [Photobacterium sp. SDRW27]|uniref:AraC family transcriptional regulator n=1 Tax=Photobacterium obscurum TaxID=2829490 RepID=UPI0022436391|nr:helix-turn-helix transcriptional regulator [Photobacterium obscurum]MCW8327629.1 helix-turn-helix transcriptional regulator [Photobacterium obscurum]
MYIKNINNFNSDLIHTPFIGIAAKLVNFNSGWHQHSKHQLLLAKNGWIVIEISQCRYFIPQGCAIWIPAQTKHKTSTQNEVELRSLFLKEGLSLPDKVIVITVTPLLREIIDTMAHWPWDKPYKEQFSLMAVFKEELNTALQHSIKLMLPQDRRIEPLMEMINKNLLPPKLTEIENTIGASSKTIGRIFLRETGLNYQSWRQQWRLMKAMELLAAKHSVSTVAQMLEFSSSSAFIAFFVKYTNQTPGRFLASL